MRFYFSAMIAMYRKEGGEKIGLTLEQQKVKKLYIEGKKAGEIIKLTGISKSKVYRWIADEALGFEESKKLAEFTTDDMVDIIDESHKKLLMEIAENPSKLLDSKTADSLCKVARVLESMAAKSDREKAAEVEGQETTKGVLIIDDVEYQYLVEQKAEETVGNSE
ncbi:helix-turn-helix domain-containing protein [Fusobacterium ulcerans]|uniref:helix-turn-helix domain-containing protein n=1 Tax=Fusobacterium ulcerans TaxID=861 RepID=UPI0027BA4B13|nr:helix-turn-helix domain-containing protein [Fusobacterium ulcerans]